VLARHGPDGPQGYWTSDPTLLSAARGALTAATQ
jgi:hypothetical protein